MGMQCRSHHYYLSKLNAAESGKSFTRRSNSNNTGFQHSMITIKLANKTSWNNNNKIKFSWRIKMIRVCTIHAAPIYSVLTLDCKWMPHTYNTDRTKTATHYTHTMNLIIKFYRIIISWIYSIIWILSQFRRKCPPPSHQAHFTRSPVIFTYEITIQISW